MSSTIVTPDFGKQFKLVVDANDLGAGIVLKQDDQSVVHYFLTRFDEH